MRVIYNWDLWSRPNQKTPEGNWYVWLLNAGRGYGKTRTGAEWVRQRQESGKYKIIHLIGETVSDARDTMIEGPAGILRISPPWNRPRYIKSLRRLEWNNGAYALVFSADDPEQLRGPQCDSIWADEIGKWRYEAAWDNAMMGLRMGDNPQVVAGTTPRPTKLIKQLVKDPGVVITNGTTYENRAYLAKRYFERVIRKYEGTRLGRQELLGHILDDNPNALWSLSKIDQYRTMNPPKMKRIVIGVDPAVTSGDDSDDTGIIAVGLGADDRGYILEDGTVHDTPYGWSSKAVELYYRWKADLIVGEVNNGGDLVEMAIRSIDRNVNYKSVRASRGKFIRAEPVSGLYQQGRVSHVGTFALLEDQMCDFVQGADESPDRMDALVWAVTELFLGEDEDEDTELW